MGDVIDVHLDAFVGEHDKTTAWDVVNVVQIVGGGNRGKVLRRL